jgi:hypothetical protein
MALYVLKNRGRGVPMSEAKAMLSEERDLVIEEESDEKKLVISGPTESIKRFASLLGWFSAPVRNVPRPAIGAMRHPPVRRI